jgi:hypothetical protein
MEELCDIISQRLSIKSVILQICGADHLAVLGGRAPKFVDFGCFTALMLQIASRRSSFPGFAQCTHYIHISIVSTVSAMSMRSPLRLRCLSAHPTMYLLTSLPNLLFPCTQACHAKTLATEKWRLIRKQLIVGP